MSAQIRILAISLFLASVSRLACATLGPYDDPHFVAGRSTIVHLFEWRWDDIADECERFLGPRGYAGVQISPPMEHVMIWADADSIIEQPWWQRYQVVSYHFNSRSGTEAELQDMIHRCNKVGVRTYADVLPEHMTSHQKDETEFGSGGSEFNGFQRHYPAVPYNASHFVGKNRCHSESGGIENWGDAGQVRDCELVGLSKLDLSQEYVRDKVADMYNRLIDMGVAGFRVDAAKHAWPRDLEAVWTRFKNLSSDFFEPGLKPFIFQEVSTISKDDPVQMSDYFHLGRAIEFRIGFGMAPVLRKWNDQLLKDLKTFEKDWEMSPSDKALAYLSNHDSQRNDWSTAKDLKVITFWEPKLQKMGHAFMLAWPYGIQRIISSYRWQRDLSGEPPHDVDKNNWVGPPHEPGRSAIVKRVPILEDGSCGAGWICEHRWRQIANMVAFRNVAGSQNVTHWWDNEKHAIAFGRADRGFLVINNEDTGLEIDLQTGLAQGKYCDVISGDLKDGHCTGAVVEIGPDGRGHFSIQNLEDPIIAIHANSKLPE